MIDPHDPSDWAFVLTMVFAAFTLVAFFAGAKSFVPYFAVGTMAFALLGEIVFRWGER